MSRRFNKVHGNSLWLDKNYKSLFFPIYLSLFLLILPKLLLAQSVENKFQEGIKALQNNNSGKAIKLLKEVVDNKKGQLAVYYYHLAAAYYANKQFRDASFTLYTLTQKFPEWNQMDRAWYLKAASQFEDGLYSEAILSCQQVKRSTADMSVYMLKEFFYRKILQADSVRVLLEKFPQDVQLQSRAEKLNPSLINNGLKDNFTIAVLQPFDALFESSKALQDVIQGILLAKDSLRIASKTLQIEYYQVDKEDVNLKQLSGQLDHVDLILGPPYRTQQNAILALYPKKPILNTLLSQNFANEASNYFLPQADVESMAQSAAKFAFKQFSIKKGILVHSGSVRDSIFSAMFKVTFERLGGHILTSRKFNKTTSIYIKSLFDKIKIDSVGFVCSPSQEPSLASNLFSVLESNLLEKTSMYKDAKLPDGQEEKKKKRAIGDIPFLVDASWLDFPSINFEQFELHNTHFIAPNGLFIESELYQKLNQKYLQKSGVPLSLEALKSYEAVLFFAHYLKIYKTSEIKSKPLAAALYPFYDFSKSVNQYVPIYTISQHQLELVEP